MENSSYTQKDLEKLKTIRALLLDVDGVLTRGEIIYDADGREIKIFSVKDGLGIKLLIKAGIKVGIVTGRKSPALSARLANLGIPFVWDAVKDKAKELGSISKTLGVPPEHMAFMGDDLPDLGIMMRVGVSLTVADAHEQLRKSADMVTRNKGGQGAVRELCEAILSAQGRMQDIIESFQH